MQRPWKYYRKMARTVATDPQSTTIDTISTKAYCATADQTRTQAICLWLDQFC